MTTVTVPTSQRSSVLLASRLAAAKAEEERSADLGEGDDGDHGDDREGREGELGEFDAEDEQRPRHQGDQHGHHDRGIELRTDHGQHRGDEGDAGVDEVGDP